MWVQLSGSSRSGECAPCLDILLELVFSEKVRNDPAVLCDVLLWIGVVYPLIKSVATGNQRSS